MLRHGNQKANNGKRSGEWGGFRGGGKEEV